MTNFSACVTVDNIQEPFELRLTKYLRDNCSIEMHMITHDQSKELASVTAPLACNQRIG